MTKAVAYIRVSTTDQNNGPEAQRDAINAWAKREGVTIASWHHDHGISGAAGIDKRPELAAALDAIKKHSASSLVVAKLDRLARDMFLFGFIEKELLKLGATIVSASGEGTNDQTPTGELMRSIVGAFAQYERAMIRARTKAALAARSARGLRTGMLPFGSSADESGKLIPNPQELAILKRISRLHDAGHSGLDIYRTMMEQGVTSPRTGKPLCRASIRNAVRKLKEKKE